MKESENYLLGLKAIIWDQPRSHFRSPSAKQFVWDRSGWMLADCLKLGRRVSEAEISAHRIPNPGCTCGIYATNTTGILHNYMGNPNAVAVLAAACGEAEVWSGGFRSQAAQVVAVVGGWRRTIALADRGAMWDQMVKMDVDQAAQLAMIASEYFGVDVVELPVALEMIKGSWQMDGYINRMDGGYGKAKKVRVQEAG
jgi:hypothetical protein